MSDALPTADMRVHVTPCPWPDRPCSCRVAVPDNAPQLSTLATKGDQQIVDDLWQTRQRLVEPILDIDAHATPFGEDEHGFVTGGYLISVGCLHRALGFVGHTAPKCRTCGPDTHDCEPSDA